MKIKYFAWLKDITKIDCEFIDDKSIKNTQNLTTFICNKYPKLKVHFKNKKIIRIAINFEYVYKNTKLHHNDEIAFFPQVSGG